MPDAYERVLHSGDRAVEGTAERVLEDRFTEDADTVGAAGGATAAATPTLHPPRPTLATDPGFVHDPDLQKCLDAVRDIETGGTKPFRALRMALVDLTDDVNRPRYAGVDDDLQTRAASLPKIGIMYAAFELRQQIAAALSGIDAKDGADVLAQLTAAWKPLWETRFDGRGKDSPRLIRMFEVHGGPGNWHVQFLWRPPRLGVEEDILNAGVDRRDVDFQSRLELALRHSDNASARECMRDLGFQYLNGALHDGGFYDEKGKGGLWLSKRYGVNEEWHGARTSPIGRTMQGATARSVALMLTLIAQDRIIRPGIALEMRNLMQNEDADPLSEWIIEGLNLADDPLPPGAPPLPPDEDVPKRWPAEYVAKIGDLDLSCDCALIRRYSYGKDLRYISVVLNASKPDIIRKVSVELDDCIRERYLPPPPPPPPPPP